MFKSILTKRNIITTVSILILFVLIGFVEKETSEKEVKNIIVNIEDKYDNHFIDDEDVMKLISAGYTDSVRGKLNDEINLKELEHRIKSNKFVKDVQVFKDFKGNILVDIEQCRPIARVIQNDGPQAYIDETGKILPVSDKFTSRVVIVDGDGANKYLDSAYMASEEGKGFVQMLQAIDKDEFLKAQVSEITRSRSGELTIRPQVGNELIEFGKPDELDVKFKKFKIYYKQITLLKGFNKYQRVNLKFQDQIICE